jgi:hypothetical protein
MADTTTFLGWAIPVLGTDPWYTAFVTLMNEIDADVYAAQAGSQSLDEAYDNGASITADTTAVSITAPLASDNMALILTQNDTTNNPNVLQIVNPGSGFDITTASNQDLKIVPHGTGITQIGNAGTTSHSLVSNDDLFASGKFEADGAAYFDSTVTVGGSTAFSSVIDDDTMGTASNTSLATSESIKAYVDTQIATKDTFLELTDTPGSYTADGAIYVANNSSGQVDESTVILTESTNTFAITKGSASLDIAAGATLNIDADLTVSNAVTLAGSNAGTIDFGAASKTLTISETCTIDQDLQQSAGPTFASLALGGNITLTGGGSIVTTANSNITLLPNGTGITVIGDAGTTDHSLNTNDDLLVTG